MSVSLRSENKSSRDFSHRNSEPRRTAGSGAVIVARAITHPAKLIKRLYIRKKYVSRERPSEPPVARPRTNSHRNGTTHPSHPSQPTPIVQLPRLGGRNRRRPLRAPRRDQARSKRSRFMTLSHAATKSRTNACCESSHA